MEKCYKFFFGDNSFSIITITVLLFSIFGFVIGYLMGLSSSPVTSALIPSLLTFIGGLMIYFFYNDKNDIKNRYLITYGIIFLSISLLFGTIISIPSRYEYERNQKILQFSNEKTLKLIDNELKKELIMFEYNLKNQESDTITFPQPIR